jgi:hypothetical protein
MRADFERALHGSRLARAARLLTVGRPRRTRPRHLPAVEPLFWQAARLQSIRVDAIVGTVDATSDFDADFRPATARIARRWEAVARAHRDGRHLPPIAVVERPDGYYVIDGRHRVSVARAFGRDTIAAWVRPSAPAQRAA